MLLFLCVKSNGINCVTVWHKKPGMNCKQVDDRTKIIFRNFLLHFFFRGTCVGWGISYHRTEEQVRLSCKKFLHIYSWDCNLEKYFEKYFEKYYSVTLVTVCLPDDLKLWQGHLWHLPTVVLLQRKVLAVLLTSHTSRPGLHFCTCVWRRILITVSNV